MKIDLSGQIAPITYSNTELGRAAADAPYSVSYSAGETIEINGGMYQR
ncbi:hypothetical protein [Paenibacillus hamazuiensis]|nr:hypothetical protein [Paenibacillus hamazuiensis]